MKQTTLLPIKQLLPNPGNPRTITKAKLDKLVQSLRQFPQMLHLRPIVVESLDNPVVLGGNMRLKALQQLGVEEVPVLTAEELTPEQRAEFIIKDNVGFGDWDWEVLANEWDPLELSDWGLDIPDLPDLKAEVEEDEIPEPPTDPLTKPGDLWILGEHRLLCGDSTDRVYVEHLINKNKIDLLLTDPPYGIGYGKKGFSGSHGWKDYGKIDWDTERPNKQTFNLIRSKAEKAIIWGGNYFTDLLPPSMGWLVWDKGQRNFSLADCELAWRSSNVAARVFTYSRAAALQDGKQHPTQKPVALIKWCLDLEKNAKKIFDPFLGSGTTLIACEQLGRTCYGMELDPKYCDVIVARWEKLTGKQAVRSYNINDHDQKETDATA